MAKLWFPSDFCKAFGSTLASGSCLPTSLNQSNHPFKKWKNATNRGASDSWHPIYIFIGYVQGWSPLEALVHTPTHLCVCIRHSKELKPLPLIHPHVSVMGSELSMNHHQLAEPNSKCPSVEAEFQNENSARNILLVIFFFLNSISLPLGIWVIGMWFGLIWVWCSAPMDSDLELVS